MRTALALVDDPLFGRHQPPSEHPERPERLDAARAGLARAHLGLPRLALEPRDASDADLTRVHQLAYIERLGQAAGRSGYLDPDTYFAPESSPPRDEQRAARSPWWMPCATAEPASASP